MLRAQVRPAAARVTPAWLPQVWIAALPVSLVGAWLAGSAVMGPLNASFTAAHLAYRVLPPSCAAWGIATLALCVWVRWVRRRRSGGIAGNQA